MGSEISPLRTRRVGITHLSNCILYSTLYTKVCTIENKKNPLKAARWRLTNNDWMVLQRGSSLQKMHFITNNNNNINTWTIYENHMSSQLFILHMANHICARARGAEMKTVERPFCCIFFSTFPFWKSYLQDKLSVFYRVGKNDAFLYIFYNQSKGLQTNERHTGNLYLWCHSWDAKKYAQVSFFSWLQCIIVKDSVVSLIQCFDSFFF